MNKQHQKDIDNILSRTHTSFMKKYGCDVKSIVANPALTSVQKHQQIVDHISASFAQKHNYQIPAVSAAVTKGSPIGAPYPYTDTIWVTPYLAQTWASDSGSAVKAAITTCQQLLDIDEAGTELDVTLAGVTGIVGVGTAWVAGAFTIMGNIMAAGATAAAVAGATAETIAAAASAAALAAGLSSTMATTAGTAAAAAAAGGAAAGSTFGGLAGLMSCMAAFALTPVGLIVIGAAVALALAGFLILLLTTEHNFTGIIINNTDAQFTLYGGSATTNGLYVSEGAMQYFPGVVDDSNSKNPQLLYIGLPARKQTSSSSDDDCIPVGLFAAEGNQGGKGSLGFFSLNDGNGTNIVFLYSNYLAGGASGVNIANDPLTDDAETIFKRLNDSRQLSVINQYSTPYYTSANCDSPAGAEAYGVYYLTPSNVF